MTRIGRHAMFRAKPEAVRRLARWMGVSKGKCTCERCVRLTVEALQRRPEMQ